MFNSSLSLNGPSAPKMPFAPMVATGFLVSMQKTSSVRWLASKFHIAHTAPAALARR